MRITRFLIVAAVLLTTACEDPFASTDWEAVPIELKLYSGSREAYVGQPSAFDLAATPPRAVAIETEAGAGTWDVVLIDHEGGLALAPASVFPGLSSSAGVATILNRDFEDVESAPGGEDAFSREPVRLQMNAVYVVRSRPTGCAFTTGPIYAKLEPLEVNVTTGVFRFNYVDNPNCGDRDLVPED